MGDVPGPSTAPYFNPRKATENFSRLCQLIMTICSDLFRDVLSHYIKPADLMLELNNNRTKLERIMNAQQKEQIYPSSGATTLTPKDLDISVLYILLRNISKLPKHRNGWGNPPLDTDTCLAACIERIRSQRNLISGHSTIGEIEDAAFQDHWDELKNNILEIESQLIGGDMYERGVEELLSCDLNPTRSEKYVREFKNIQGELLIKREKMENLESAQKTTKRHLAVKRARLDDIEERQSTTTSQIRDLQTTLLTTIHDTFKDLETTLLTTMQEMSNVSSTRGRKRAMPNASSTQGRKHRKTSFKPQTPPFTTEATVTTASGSIPNRSTTQTVPSTPAKKDATPPTAPYTGNGGYTASLKTPPDNKQGHYNRKDGCNALHEACRNGTLDMCKYLIQIYPDLLHSVQNGGWNAALFAAGGGNVEILQLLADNGVNVKHKNNVGCNILHVACGNSNLEMSRYIIQTYPDFLHSVDNGGWNVALHAAKGGNFEILKLLVENKVDVKLLAKNGWNILHAACFNANLEMSRYIIQTYPDLLHSVDNHGQNAALHAARGGNVKILQLLVDNEVDVKHKNNVGCNIIHVACGYSKLEMSRYIIQTYPDLLHSVDNIGWNAAFFAVRGGNVEIVKLLNNHGVQI